MQDRSVPRLARAVAWLAHWMMFGLTLWTLAWPLAASSQPAMAPLTLAEAQQAAEEATHRLDALAAVAHAARERAVAAAQRPDPVLRIGLDNVPIEGDGSHRLTREPTTARSIGLTQAWPDAAKRAARGAQFDRDAEAALARRALQRRTLRRETALAWWDLHTLGAQLAVLQAQQTEAVLLVDAAEAAYRAGRGMQADVFAARAARARLQDGELRLQAQFDDARERLRRWVDEAALRPLAAPPPLDQDPLPDHAAGADPELAAAQARVLAAGAAAEVAREERRADWSVDLRFAQRGPRYDNMLTLGLSIPLRWDLANRQDRELAARLALLQQAQDEASELERERDADLARWRLGWRSGVERLRWLDDTRQPLAAARTDAALAAYRAGSGSLQAVLDARQAALALATERLQIERDTAGHWLRLATLTPPPENER